MERSLLKEAPPPLVDRSAPLFWVKVFTPGTPAPARVDVSERVTSFEFEDLEGAADKLELSLDNFDLSVFDDPIWKKGNLIEASWGYAGNMAPARECVIQSIKGSKVLKVIALAKSILMNKKPIVRTFARKTRADIVRQIAEENGYGPSVQLIEDTEIILDHVTQPRLTDAQFLMHLAKKEGFEFYVDFEGLHFHRRKMGQKPRRAFTYYVDQRQGDLIDFNVENDVSLVPGQVSAKGRDPLNKKDINVTADSSTKRNTLAPFKAIDGKTGGAEFRYQAASASTLTNATSADAAKREAEGRLIKAQQTTVIMTLSCVGDPSTAAKQVIEVRGISKKLSGKYYISIAKHKLASESYTMELKVRSDGGHRADGVASATNVGDLNKNGIGKDGLREIREIDSQTGAAATRYRPGGSK